MNETVTQETVTEGKITATAVAESERIRCLPKHFGARMMIVEHTIYHFMSQFVESYRGGLWEFYELSNGGFYMAPKIDSPVELGIPTNGFEAKVSADAAGIIVCLFALSHLSFKYEDERIAEHYHLLFDYACQHPESSDICGAID